MRRLRWLLAAAPLLLAQAGPPDRTGVKPVLVPDVSQRDIEIAYSFTGADLLLFGAILYPGGRVPGAGDAPDVAVVVKGPAQSILVREKKKVAGIWINAARLRYRSAPSFYAIASSRPIERLVDERTRAIYELGVDSLQLSPASSAPADVQDRFQRGLVDLQRRAGLYYEAPHSVEITAGVLYRARLRIPARVPVGRFTAETFLIRDGRVLAAAVRAIDVRKSGAERLVARAAERSSITYGLAAVAMSVFLGWFAGWIAGRR
ncbi:MAG: TIGR02186 family protein [Janthinobacterium lividum]